MLFTKPGARAALGINVLRVAVKGGQALFDIQRWKKRLMRGDAAFLAFGAPYLRSEPLSESIQARIISDIPNAPKGTAFVRWGIRPKIGGETSVQITGVGRLGNSVIQVLNSLAIARTLNSREVLYPLFNAIGNKDFDIHLGTRLKRMSFLNRFGHRAPSIIWRTYAMTPGGAIIDPCSSEFQPARLALANNLAYELSTPRRDGNQKELVIYVRSGDIFSPNPERNYGQPPWVFYEKVLRHDAWNKVRLVSEDQESPVIERIFRWCMERGVKIVHTGSTLSDAIRVISQAKYLVGARGTFVPAIIYLTGGKRTLYFFHEPPNALICDSSNEVYAVLDKEGHYVSSIMAKNWRNSDEQRLLMVEYPSEALSDIQLT